MIRDHWTITSWLGNKINKLQSNKSNILPMKIVCSGFFWQWITGLIKVIDQTNFVRNQTLNIIATRYNCRIDFHWMSEWCTGVKLSNVTDITHSLETDRRVIIKTRGIFNYTHWLTCSRRGNFNIYFIQEESIKNLYLFAF